MPQRLTTQIFIARAVATHGNTYDYSLVDYTKNNKLVKIVCRVHGVFEQMPVNHMLGFGDGQVPQMLEEKLLKELSFQYKKPSEKYDGRTESFLDVDVEELLSRIRQLSSETIT